LRSAKRLRTQFANFQNTSFLRTSKHKNALQALEVLQPYFKASKGISRTSLCCGILIRFAIKIFSLPIAQLEKLKKVIPTSYVQG
jgi:hypothetical protein